MFDSIKEECGVFGIYNFDESANVSKDVYTALYALQHRGQESAGIAVNFNGKVYSHKDLGLVNDVFDERILTALSGNFACGHVRYAMSGDTNRDNAQPFVAKHTKGQIAIAHNGNIVNTDKLRQELSMNGAIFQTSADTEIITHLVARERIKTESTEDALINIMDKLTGAYSLVILTMNKLIAVRDSNGFRPLCIGKLDNAIIFASESCAIDAIGGKFIRDVEPGEVIIVNKDGMNSRRDKCGTALSSFCIFEHIYFARPDSVIDGQSVHFARKAAGAELAKQHPVDADIVIGVPDSGIDAALGYAEESGIPYGVGLIKNRYVGRTFIQNSQEQRERAVKIKLNPLASALSGKRVVIIDDSIVRGTTTANLVMLMRESGASEVHVRISSPPFLFPCYFGTDIKSKDKLIACRMTVEEIQREINADSLGYLSVEALSKIAPGSKLGMCDACFTGNYNVEVPES